MARPQKCGMDYFPHDTDALTDEKIEALRMLYGNDGYAFYFIMLERIYRTEHFELDVSDAETIQILCKKLNVTEELFNKMLSTALKRGCFDNDYYQKEKKLTSIGIKRRASVVIEKRIKSKDDYIKKVSATETTQETPTETEQKVHKGEERKEYIKKKEKKEELLAQAELFFAECWGLYPRKEGKASISNTTKLERFKLGDEFKRCIERYNTQIKKNGTEKQYIKQGSTFWNSGYVDYLDAEQTQQKPVTPLVIIREDLVHGKAR